MSEITKIETTVEKITSKARISELAIDNTTKLSKLITGGKNPYTLPWPVNKFSLPLPEELQNVEDITFNYIGLEDRPTKTLLQDLEGLDKLIATDSVNMVFLSNKKNILRVKFTNYDLYDSIDFNRLPELYKVSFTDLLNTKEVFGLYKKKMTFANEFITDYSIQLCSVYTLQEADSYVMSCSLPGIKSKHNENGAVKFCIQDLIFHPKISLKGYNLPKDRTLQIGSRVVLKVKGKFQNVKGVVREITKGNIQIELKGGKRIVPRVYIVELEDGQILKLKQNQLRVI